jgi:acetyl-CoA carboxylase alpha subunit
MATALKDVILRHLRELQALTMDEMQERRYAKFRAIGEVREAVAVPA